MDIFASIAGCALIIAGLWGSVSALLRETAR